MKGSAVTFFSQPVAWLLEAATVSDPALRRLIFSVTSRSEAVMNVSISLTTRARQHDRGLGVIRPVYVHSPRSSVRHCVSPSRTSERTNLSGYAKREQRASSVATPGHSVLKTSSMKLAAGQPTRPSLRWQLRLVALRGPAQTSLISGGPSSRLKKSSADRSL